MAHFAVMERRLHNRHLLRRSHEQLPQIVCGRVSTTWTEAPLRLPHLSFLLGPAHVFKRCWRSSVLPLGMDKLKTIFKSSVHAKHTRGASRPFI